MFFLYQTILTILLLFSPIIIILRIIKNKENKIRFLEKFGITKNKRRKGKLIWFHGASVGELLSIIPLIQYYEKNKLIDQILVTSSTLSSQKILEKYKFKKTLHQFYPIDHYLISKKFLNTWKPNFVIFIESEVWPCMFLHLQEKNIPLVLLNARLTKKTFDRWMKIKTFAKLIFSKIKIAYPQNIETKNYLNKLEVKKISNLGNLKFIEHFNERKKLIHDKRYSNLKSKNIWVASSTHNREEIFCAKTHIILKKKYKNLITIIIPRHINRVKKIISEIKNLNLTIELHSKSKKSLNNIDIYLVDTFGETKKFFNISSTVFLGGSIVKKGGQNPLEAARYGAKIVHGPNIDNFKDIYRLLKSMKISYKIKTPKNLASLILFKKKYNTGNKIKNIGVKVLKKTIKELDYLIKNEFKKT